MIKIFVKDGYVVYDGGRGPSYSIDNAVLKALYKMEMGHNKAYLINADTGLPMGTLQETDSHLTNAYLHNLNVPKKVVIAMYKAMVEGNKV